MVKPKKSVGRPSSYDPATVDQIIERVSNGEPLAAVCRDIGLGLTTWYDWVAAREGISESIARAREAGFDMIAADALRIADTPLEGTETEESENGLKIKKGDMLGHRKLQIETRLKLLAKWDPKRYGEKMAIGGADDLPAIKTIADDSLDAKIAALMAKQINERADEG